MITQTAIDASPRVLEFTYDFLSLFPPRFPHFLLDFLLVLSFLDIHSSFVIQLSPHLVPNLP